MSRLLLAEARSAHSCLRRGGLSSTRHVALALLGLTVGPTVGVGQPEPARVTSASNVRMRAEPSVEVPIVTALRLGTEVVETGVTPDRAWVRVRTSAGQEGWVRSELTRSVPAGRRLQVLEQVIEARLYRQGDGFSAWLELIALIDRIKEDMPDPEAAGRIALYRLRAMAGAARSGRHSYRPKSDVVAAWLAVNADALVDNEPGGQWMLRREAILAERDRHPGTRAADDIAWFAAENGLPGECEGDLPCYIAVADSLQGEYLRTYPAGRHVWQAVDRLLSRTPWWSTVARDRRLFSPATDCPRLAEPLASLRTAVDGAVVTPISEAPRQQLLDVLDDVGRGCAV